MEDPENSGGRLLRLLRLRQDLSQAELAQRAGLSRGYLTLIERGERRPRAGAAARLADALELGEAERRELMAAFANWPSVSAEPGSAAATSNPLTAALAEFLALAPGSPEGPRAMERAWKSLMVAMADKAPDEDAAKAVRSARLLGLGYFCAKGPERRQKGQRKNTRQYEIEMAESVRALLEMLVDARIPAHVRATLARELVSFAKWRTREAAEGERR